MTNVDAVASRVDMMRALRSEQEVVPIMNTAQIDEERPPESRFGCGPASSRSSCSGCPGSSCRSSLPEALMYAVLSGAALGIVIVVWWLFFSRAPWLERVGALALIVGAVFATRQVVHPSIANGHMGVMLPLYSVPVFSLALVAWAALSRRLASGPRIAALLASVLLACGVCTLVRTDGIRGEGASDLHWRWTPTAEERLLAQAGAEPSAPAPPVAKAEDAPPVAPAGESQAERALGSRRREGPREATRITRHRRASDGSPRCPAAEERSRLAGLSRARS